MHSCLHCGREVSCRRSGLDEVFDISRDVYYILDISMCNAGGRSGTSKPSTGLFPDELGHALLEIGYAPELELDLCGNSRSTASQLPYRTLGRTRPSDTVDDDGAGRGARISGLDVTMGRGLLQHAEIS